MGYALDTAGQEFARSFVGELRKQAPKKPVTHVRFFIEQTGITGWHAFVFTEPRAEQLSVSKAAIHFWCSHDQKIPSTVDDRDATLTRFCKKHRIDPERLAWRDLGLGLLGGLYFRELLGALRDAKNELAASKIKLAKTARFAMWDEDKIGFDTNEKPARYDAPIKHELRALKLGAPALADFAKLCFASDAKRAWLTALAK